MKFTLLLLAFSLLSFFNILSADISKFYKKITDKTPGHTMKNIDFIYMINLDHRPEKLKKSMEQLKPYNINPFRFSAVNGKDLSLETINQLGVKYEPWMKENEKDRQNRRTYVSKDGITIHYEVMNDENKVYFHHSMGPGPLGCILSHLSILRDAYYHENYETIWIMEDDIQIIRDPHLVSNAIDKLDAEVGKNKWDILYTDQDTKGPDGKYQPYVGYLVRPNFTPLNLDRYIRQMINNSFIKIGSRYGTYSMIMRRSGIKKILDFIDQYKIFLPYDHECLLPDIEAYTVIDDIVSTQPQAISDIR